MNSSRKRGCHLVICRYRPEDAPAWDRFIGASINGTFLHTRKFLSYHGNRFDDQSLIIRDEHGAMVGVLPAAVDPDDPRCVTSHPGITYGGVVHAGELYGTTMVNVLEQCVNYYRTRGFRRFRYKTIPTIYHQFPAEDDIYALFRLGAALWRTDLCAVIDHRARRPLSRNRKTGLKRSMGIEVSADPRFLSDFWVILEDQLEQRHNVNPVHTIAEIQDLMTRFPTDIACMTGHFNGQVTAGLLLFLTPLVTRAQYSGATDTAREISALDRVFDWCIAASAQRQARYFDLGNSNEADGQVLNMGLHRYKVGLGAGSMTQRFFELTN
jgi:hypothetical protein